MGAEDGLELVAAIAAAVGGLLLLVRRTALLSGWLLIATAAAMPLGHVTQPAGSVPLTLALLLGGAAPALAATAGVLWPVARTAPLDRLAAATALGCTLVLGGLLPTLLEDPAAGGCHACAPNLLEVRPAVEQADALFGLGAASALLWGPLLVLVAIRRLLAASPLSRRQGWPVVGGACVAVLAAVSAGHGLALPADVTDATQQDIRALEAAAVVLIASGAPARVYLAATARRRMARIVLEAIPEHEVVLASLRRAVGDESIDVHYVRTDGRLIDADGDPVVDEREPALQLRRGGQVFAELCADRRTAGPAGVLRSAADAAGLALEYLAAQARFRAELRDAADVRSRLVAAGSAERWRLERNLHDGAQQRLVALELMLTAASLASGVQLAGEQAEIDAALQELRGIARGLFPTGLAESDLEAALRELGDHTTCPLLLSGRTDEPVPLAGKMAVYQLVTEVAAVHPHDTALQVELAGGADRPIEVTLTAAMPESADLRSHVLHAEDRFVAAGGRLTMRTVDDVTVVRGEAPCAS